MLIGEDYDSARKDFDKSIALLKDNVGEIETIQKEKLKLNRLEKTVRENETKCKNGMKSILGGKEESGLHSDANDERLHSTLRSCKKQPSFQPIMKKDREIAISLFECALILLILTISAYIAISCTSG